MLPGYDVCPECGGEGVLGGCQQPCDHAHTYMYCPACSGVGSVPGDAAVQALRDAIPPYVRRLGSDAIARAALVAYAQQATREARRVE